MPLLHVLEFASWADKWQSLSKPKKRVVIGLAVACPFVLVATVLRWDLWNDIDINTYYYYLSTISQTLAGAFAFLVAVALFRMQSIEGDMERSFREVIPYAPDHHRGLLEMMNRSHDWHDLDRYVRQEMIDAIPDDDLKSAVSTNLNTVKMGLDTLSDLKSELVDTLRLTSIVIGFSLVGIPVCQILKTKQGQLIAGPFLAMVFLSAILLPACRCLERYWDIAKHLADTRPRHTYASGSVTSTAVVAGISPTPTATSSEITASHAGD